MEYKHGKQKMGEDKKKERWEGGILQWGVFD